MKMLYFLILFLPLGAYAKAPASEGTGVLPRIERACTTSEKWVGFDGKLHPEALDFLKILSSAKTTPEQIFSEGLALGRRARTELETAASEYLMAKALLHRRILLPAEKGFKLLLTDSEGSPSTLVIERAAFECLGEVHRLDPSFRVGERVNLKEEWFVAGGGVSEKTALDLLLSDERYSPSVEASLFKLFSTNSPAVHFVKAVQAARVKNHAGVIHELAPLVALPAWPQSIERRKVEALLLLGRAYFSTGKFDKSAETYRLVPKSSNQLAQSLVELSWAYLMAKRYPDAVGTAIHLRIGGLSRTFSPESEMVIAMAENEICQYPDSIRALDFFKKQYHSSYLWLEAHAGNSNWSPYDEVLAFLKKKSKVPPRVAGEWVRTNAFIASEEGILRLNAEDKRWAESIMEARKEEQRWQAELVVRLKVFRRDYEMALRRVNPALLARFKELRKDLQRFRRFIDAAPIANLLMEKAKPDIPVRKEVLKGRIERRILAENERMLTQLREIAENNESIEIEIFSGASQDLVWKEAHPDYDDTVGNAKMDGEDRPNNRFWNWGRTPSSELESSEIWEDELGSSQADLNDNCSNQEKYLEIKANALRRKKK